ncbi:MAG: DUF2914 domain-containing protein [Deferribacteres bacterium]|nr:DUF2914 domain-containing protein [candidate division KSB1 bacterium]MCB9503984.1 DUF2914 domain-containing protein [Deferribacteres bacterium]
MLRKAKEKIDPLVSEGKERLEVYTTKGKEVYKRYEKFYPVIFFLAGFLYDSLTLNIENTFDHFILLLYTIVAGGMILLIGMLETGQITHEKILRYKKWYPNILQFLLGGLFSAYVVFYFKSAAISKSLIFVCFLLILMVLNEFFHHKMLNITFLCTLYFFSTFAFLTFFLPIITHKLNTATFFSSGIIGFLITSGIVTVIYRQIFKDNPKEIFGKVSPPIIVFGIMSFFYMANWIPPVPLSMKDGGIYHFVKKNPSEGTYTVKYYRDWFLKFWDNSDNVYHWASGDTVFCYASIFAPIDWEATVYYQWRKYDPGQEKWNDRDRLSYAISGGRKGGYRGFTYKRNIDEGEWRVDIETEYGQVLGRIEFDVVASEAADRKEIIATK